MHRPFDSAFFDVVIFDAVEGEWVVDPAPSASGWTVTPASAPGAFVTVTTPSPPAWTVGE